MAPEVIVGGSISVLTDIYQAGLTIFRLACGVSELRSKLSSLGWNDYCKAVTDGTLVSKDEFAHHVPASVRRIILKASHPDPAERFQTALEMRRAIEKLSFPGHWTVDPSGQSIGMNGHNQFRFEKLSTGVKVFSVTSYKKNQRTGHEVRVSEFCGRDLTSGQANALVEKFIKSVVTGS